MMNVIDKVIEKIIERNIGGLSKEYDCIHGANINIQRISPDVIDGLKPVQRRALFDMFINNQRDKFKKLGSISGDTFGKFHPHAPTSISDAVANMAQWWNNPIPLVSPSGNFGGVDGSEAGADRYISAKLSEYAYACFFEDWDHAVVDMVDAYDGESKEPLYLPCKYPNVLLNGSIGIGYGTATNLPPFNFKELIDACITLIMDPDAEIVLIPDSPTGCDIITTDFAKICNTGVGKYKMRAKYEIDAENNIIKITALPYLVSVNSVRERIAAIKAGGGLPELVDMDDRTKINTDLRLVVREDENPYKFMKKLISKVSGIERPYAVSVTVTNKRTSVDYSVKKTLEEWLKYDREQKRIVVSHKYTSLLAEQRTNDVMIFLTEPEHMDEIIKMFRTSRKSEIQPKLVNRYKDTEIQMDSLQAKAVAKAGLEGLTIDARENYLKRREELKDEIKEVEEILDMKNGIDKLIIAELRDGAKRFGTPRKSNVIPEKISIGSKVNSVCILQLSSDGMITRRIASNAQEEPVPTDSNGFAVKVDDESSFILIDENGYHTFVKVVDLPLDTEVPVNRYAKRALDGNIVAMLPVDFDSDMCCTLVSRKGQIKRIRIADMAPSKKPCIMLDDDDKLVRGVTTLLKSKKDLLVYTKAGMGQRFDPNSIRVTSPLAKGGNGFKLIGDDEIIGCYVIDPMESQYLLYATSKGKFRLNSIEYLPVRDSKHDAMVSLISLNDRDRLVAIIGCNKLDKVNVFFDDGTSEEIELHRMEESTMSSPAIKMVNKNMVSNSIVKVKLK